MIVIVFSYIFLILIVLLAIFILTNFLVYRSFAPWVPSRRRDRDRIFALAQLQPGQVFYDLGCGPGGLVFAANEKFAAKAIGLEINLVLFWLCKLQQLFRRQENVIFKYQDLYKADLSDADVIYFYGIPTKNGLVSQKLRRELKPGTKIISYSFSLPGWTPAIVDRPTKRDKQIYVYQV